MSEHDQLSPSGQTPITAAFNMATKLPPSSKRAREITSTIGYFIARDMHPITVVQGVGFQNLLKHLEPRYQIPHRKTFMERVLPDLYVKVRETVVPIVAAAEYYALTTDCWTSRANEAYAGVTFHTITNEWQFQCFVLENEELSVQHTAENLAEALESVLRKWKLVSTKLAGVTVDNAANIKKAIVDVLQWNCVGCFGHTVNLCVKAGLKQQQVHTAVARCSRLVTFFRKSTRAAQVLTKKQEALETPQHKLLQDVETRWSSTYDMVRRVMEQQAPVCATLMEMKRMDLLPTDGEFSLLEEVLRVLKPFKDVTVQMSAEKYVTISAISPLLHHLLNNVLKVEDSESSAVKKMKQDMASNLSTRYHEPAVAELLNLACFVDPRFKNLPFMDDDERKLLYDNVVAKVMMHVVPEPEEEQPVQGSEHGEEEPPMKKPKTLLGQLLGGMFSKAGEKKRMSIREKAEAEMKQYLDEPPLDIDESVLQWWSQNHRRFPAIATVAKGVLCIPATSTPSERLFSRAGHIINSRRASLDSEHASMLCFLAENLQ